MRIKSRFLHKLISINILCGGIALVRYTLSGCAGFDLRFLLDFGLRV